MMFACVSCLCCDGRGRKFVCCGIPCVHASLVDSLSYILHIYISVLYIYKPPHAPLHILYYSYSVYIWKMILNKIQNAYQTKCARLRRCVIIHYSLVLYLLEFQMYLQDKPKKRYNNFKVQHYYNMYTAQRRLLAHSTLEYDNHFIYTYI